MNGELSTLLTILINYLLKSAKCARAQWETHDFVSIIEIRSVLAFHYLKNIVVLLFFLIFRQNRLEIK